MAHSGHNYLSSPVRVAIGSHSIFHWSNSFSFNGPIPSSAPKCWLGIIVPFPEMTNKQRSQIIRNMKHHKILPKESSIKTIEQTCLPHRFFDAPLTVGPMANPRKAMAPRSSGSFPPTAFQSG